MWIKILAFLKNLVIYSPEEVYVSKESGISLALYKMSRSKVIGEHAATLRISEFIALILMPHQGPASLSSASGLVPFSCLH